MAQKTTVLEERKKSPQAGKGIVSKNGWRKKKRRKGLTFRRLNEAIEVD
jgi:hypothetical protein